ncbi:MAG: class I SAM-dependent methyltransferase [Treponema sp.]|jgi:2-polyprenyl-3-methyl-5-hydroxy-6-metoxy-1,4-benzoquinol methylase|nr:class I SAM-dependent methyltransferase [Treponema sp.]
MENGNTEEVIKQFDRIALLQDRWDHNQRYQQYLLKNIPRYCTCILDVGCGTGELTKRLIPYAHEIIGIDVSENMLREAQRRNGHEKIRYIKIPVETYLQETDKKFDVIISIAALHHMHEENILKIMKAKLRGHGKILIVDLVKSERVMEWFLSILAALVNPIIRLLMDGRITVTKEEKEAWAGHFQYDTYVTLREVQRIVKASLGAAAIRRHFFWRYSIVYTHGE